MDAQEGLVELLTAVAAADRGAYAELYAAVGAKLYGVALRIVKQQSVAEEALQDGFLKIWQHAGDYRAERGAPMTWMTSIVRHGSIDALRRTRPESPLDEADAIAGAVDEAASPFEWAAASAEARRLKACLERLGEQQRWCVVMAYVEGYTHRELARRFDCPLGTVKSWIRRSLTQLRSCLEQ